MVLTIKSLITDSWNKTNGVKSRYWSIYGINILILLFPVVFPIFFIIYSYKSHFFDYTIPTVVSILSFLILGSIILTGFFLVIIFGSGLFYLCLMHTRGTLLSVPQFIRHVLVYKWRMLGAWILLSIASSFVTQTAFKISPSLNILLLFFLLLYALTILGIVDQNKGVFASLKNAIIYFFKHIVICIATILWTIILVLGTFATLGILGIWAAPATRNMYAMLYEDMNSSGAQ